MPISQWADVHGSGQKVRRKLEKPDLRCRQGIALLRRLAANREGIADDTQQIL